MCLCLCLCLVFAFGHTGAARLVRCVCHSPPPRHTGLAKRGFGRERQASLPPLTSLELKFLVWQSSPPRMAGELESSRCALLDLKQRARCAAGLQKRVLALALQLNGWAVVPAERVRAPIAPCSDVFVRGALSESVGCASRAEAGFTNLACDASGGEGGGHPGKEVLAGFAARPDEAVGDGREQRRVLCARQDAALAVDPAEEHVKDCSRVKVRLCAEDDGQHARPAFIL